MKNTLLLAEPFIRTSLKITPGFKNVAEYIARCPLNIFKSKSMSEESVSLCRKYVLL